MSGICEVTASKLTFEAIEAGAELWCLWDSNKSCCFSLSDSGECATSLSRFLRAVFSSTSLSSCMLDSSSECYGSWLII